MHLINQRETAQGGLMATSLDGKAVESKDCSCASCLFSSLPDDVLVEILCRVTDRKHLIRLKSVCKCWNNLITDACVPKISDSSPLRGFIYHVWRRVSSGKTYIDYIPCAMTPAVAPEPHEFVKSYSSLLPFEPACGDFLDCCNGLLLFVEGSIPQYYVCNPVTKQCVAIPRDFTLEDTCSASLAFDPFKSPHYRVVCFDYSEPKGPLRLRVFSSETGSWTIQETAFGYGSKKARLAKHCIYLDGVLYRQSASKLLLCFDLNRGNSRAIELPEKERLAPNDYGCIGLSRRHLCYSDLVGTALHFWLFEDRCKNDRWTLIHNINVDYLGKHVHRLDRTTIARFGKISALRPFALHPTSEVVFFGTGGAMLSYDPEDKRVELIYTTKKDRQIMKGQISVFPYTPCLVNLKDFGQCWNNLITDGQ
ncbi:PREDICTED: F-box protein At5g07610-like [Populus euphratica]|uniref:F-box protein At5g07610-like n=1 Tax=Populus euphratica TaxID=75702 RepID=A0AAJ6UPY1_POPEU|nr:PREDICTED: F-box protein At5g07610-like [Populus euphratica]